MSAFTPAQVTLTGELTPDEEERMRLRLNSFNAGMIIKDGIVTVTVYGRSDDELLSLKRAATVIGTESGLSEA